MDKYYLNCLKLSYSVHLVFSRYWLRQNFGDALKSISRPRTLYGIQKHLKFVAFSVFTFARAVNLINTKTKMILWSVNK